MAELKLGNFTKLVPTFDGEPQRNAEEWLQAVRMTKMLIKAEDKTFMFLVQTRLRDKAAIWWTAT
ncbi:MAG: hypothetical protein QQN63_07525, partial [Nitrosopumilus sp.]